MSKQPWVNHRSPTGRQSNNRLKSKESTSSSLEERGQYGHVWLKLEPQEEGAGYEFVDSIKGGVVPKEYIPSVDKGIKETMNSGVLAGFPVVDVRSTAA